MTMEDLENKFNALSSKLFSSSRQREIKDAILSCESLSSSEFMKLLIV